MTQTRERPKDLIDKIPRPFPNIDSPLDKTKTLTMARSQATKKVTRKGSKQLTDEERASQVASPIRSPSPTIPPGEIDETDPDDEDPGSRAQEFARQIAADEAQEKRAQMIANDRKRAERAKQRANTRGSAVPEPLENENDSDNDNRDDDLFSNDSNADPDKGVVIYCQLIPD